MPSREEMQRDIARIALQDETGAGFALAGSGAIREHGLIHRPTADVDLFTVMSAQDKFNAAIDGMQARLDTAGYDVEIPRQSESFARMVVSKDDLATEMDLGIDWRSREPVTLEVGPVLAVEDAVANKVAALYSRGEARDFLDVDSIRESGRYTDRQLMDMAANSDPGFDATMFADRLQLADRIQPFEVAGYGVSASDLDGVKTRSREWSTEITQPTTTPKAERGLTESRKRIAQAADDIRSRDDEPQQRREHRAPGPTRRTDEGPRHTL